MSKPLKQAVRQHLDEINLNDDQLNDLQTLVASGSTVIKHQGWYRWLIITAAAAFATVFIASDLIFQQPNNIAQRIAQEVVHNHLKLKPLEIKTSSIEGVRQYFTKLDFMPVNSELLKDSGLLLTGGRYCSLQGITAAQLRVRQQNSNTVQTFYQTEYRESVFAGLPDIEQGDAPVEVYVKGIKVKIWVEKGLVFALTEAPT